MITRLFDKRTPLRFKHFTRKGYALFACLGKEVTVGVLSVSTLTYAKADGISVNGVPTDSLSRLEKKLDEVIVTGSRAPLTDLQSAKIVTVVTREDIQRAASVGSVNDILKLATGVDVRQRGGFGVQTDISVRGGNFDQIAILLNGVNISSPHTGHLSADLPINPDDIERIEVLEGSAARVFGASAFCGVVNIITGTVPTQGTEESGAGGLSARNDGIDANISGGSYGYFDGSASLFAARRDFSSRVSGGYSRSDGATPNSAFSSSRLFWQGNLRLHHATLHAQAGYSYKPYEANTFYGTAADDQWESNERWMAALGAEITAGPLHIAPKAYWNRWYDHYQWHHGSPDGENYHRADALGGALNAWFETVLGRTALGAELRRETIWSTKLGRPQPQDKWKDTGGHDARDSIKYRYHDARSLWSAYLEHNILLRSWTVSLGATAIHTPFGGWEICPGVDVSYRRGAWKLFASWNMGMRCPTFTDLYYSGDNIEGNPELKPERANDFGLGLRGGGRGWAVEGQMFYSHKSDMIDWVTYGDADDGIFHSVNFRMDGWGGELNLSLTPQELFSGRSPIRRLTAKYCHISQHSRYGVAIGQSKYAMEYLRNKVVVSAEGRLAGRLNFTITWSFRDRVGADNPSYALLDARISWDERRWSLYVDGSNLFDKTYFDYVSVPQPGIVVKAGAKVRL